MAASPAGDHADGCKLLRTVPKELIMLRISAGAPAAAAASEPKLALADAALLLAAGAAPGPVEAAAAPERPALGMSDVQVDSISTTEAEVLDVLPGMGLAIRKGAISDSSLSEAAMRPVGSASAGTRCRRLWRALSVFAAFRGLSLKLFMTAVHKHANGQRACVLSTAGSRPTTIPLQADAREARPCVGS